MYKSLSFRIAINTDKAMILEVLRNLFKVQGYIFTENSRFTLSNNYIIINQNEDFDIKLCLY